ncbi:hypothetical protein BpHYR1_010568 [Brachionus plicatilis]|uniref:Uncharacterized protein n=1 Tax=Brachionus plicatilis TaxID=10195 RepID=A0A3M7Q7W6_BRAPC|nr:hypothetical protein BpHYR1_010568 [Brachionus plicatilis]
MITTNHILCKIIKKRAHSTIRKEKRTQQNLKQATAFAINQLNNEIALSSTSAKSTSNSWSLLVTSNGKSVLDDMLGEARVGKKVYKQWENFTKSILVTNPKKQKVDFACIFCGVKTKGHLGSTSNTLTHLERHSNIPDLMEWMKNYKLYSNSREIVIDDFTMKLATSGLDVQQMKKVHACERTILQEDEVYEQIVCNIESRKESGEMKVIQEIVVTNIPRKRNIRNVLNARIKERATEEGMSHILYFGGGMHKLTRSWVHNNSTLREDSLQSLQSNQVADAIKTLRDQIKSK